VKSIIPKVIKKKKAKRPETIAERRLRENNELLQTLYNSPFEVGMRASMQGENK
jgi:hypothetical protein